MRGPVGVGVGGEVRGRRCRSRRRTCRGTRSPRSAARSRSSRYDEDGELLADGGRRRGLAVGVREHRDGRGRRRRGRAGASTTASQPRQPDLLDGGAGRSARRTRLLMSSLVQAKCVSSAIASSRARTRRCAHEVLDGLHVVPGGGLERGQLVDLGAGRTRRRRRAALLLARRRAATDPNMRAVGEGDRATRPRPARGRG